MLIKTRKVVSEKEKYQDEETGRVFTFTNVYENGFVEEREINVKDIVSFSTNKQVRLIGIDKLGLFPMTLKSWKETKKELARLGELQKFNYSKVR